mmetsp:Transcript_3455/g.4250  ORF Transcript_3455/g.4250 Transcript_3455/m.4250 type:complete len:129 (+) Transcript_3455:2-388(+)
MNILNQKFDSDEEDEEYVPKGKDAEVPFTAAAQNDTIRELKKQKQEKEVDDIWAEMLKESNSRPSKRAKIDEDKEQPIKPELAAKSKPEEKKEDPLADATAKALQAIQAMKEQKSKQIVKEKVTFAGG